MSAIKEYENNKWKVIGQKVGKPAKACEQYAKEHFPGKQHPKKRAASLDGAQFPNLLPRSSNCVRLTLTQQIFSILRSVARSCHHDIQPWRRIASRMISVLYPSART